MKTIYWVLGGVAVAAGAYFLTMSGTKSLKDMVLSKRWFDGATDSTSYIADVSESGVVRFKDDPNWVGQLINDGTIKWVHGPTGNTVLWTAQ